mgnify:CR=1 FL=1
MQFYKFEGFVTNKEWTDENETRSILRERARKIQLKSTDFNQTLQDQSCLYVTHASDHILRAGIICRESSELQKQIQAFLESLDLSVKDMRIDEITFTAARSMLQTSCRHDFIDDDVEILERFDLDRLCGHLVAHALIQLPPLRLIAEGLDVVIDLRFPLLFGRGFGIVIKSLRQVLYRFGEGVFQLPAVRLYRRVYSAV